MSNDKRNLGDVEFSGAIKTQTFKQFQLERLIKEGKIIPASKLEEAKALELQRTRDFESAMLDEERHQRITAPAPKNKIEQLPLTRERFEE